MKSIYNLLFLVLLAGTAAHATHIKGGEIMAAQVSALTYNIKVRLYLDNNVGAGATSALQAVTVCFGDGNTADFSRKSEAVIPGSESVIAVDFDGTYTYASSGIFQISTSLGYRVNGLLNLPDSERSPVFLWTVLNTEVPNATPIFPYLMFEAGVRQLFTIDLSPTAKDADSTTVRLPKLSKASPGTCGVRMTDDSYLFPNQISANGTFKVIPALKQLQWKAPEKVGQYIFAMVIEEWRDGTIISETYREGVIVVTDKPGPIVEIPPYEYSEDSGLAVIPRPSGTSSEVSLAIEAFPIPTTDYVTAKVSSPQRSVIKLQLLDLAGRVLQQHDSKTLVLTFEKVFDMRNMHSGVYLIRAIGDNDSVTQKVVR